jgi:serpin B
MTTAWKSRFLAWGIVLVLVLAGCGEDAVQPPPAGDSPPPDPATLESRIGNTNAFAFDLYAHLRATEGNLIVSPHSIVTDFGMVYAGARGRTEREIAEVLRFNYPPAGFHSVLKRLNDILESRGSGVDPQSFRLHIACSAWSRPGFVFVPAYLDTLAVNYDAGLRTVDFAGQPEAARQEINQWVADETEDLIQNLIARGQIDGLTVLVLANAMYFRASWLDQFDPDYTSPAVFTRLDGSTVTVPIMTGELPVRYYDGNGFKAIAMPYEGEECSMLLLLPDQGTFESFEAVLTPAVVDSIVRELPTRAWSVIVRLPQFSFDTRFDLDAALKAMGMIDAFEPRADFSGITPGGGIWISFVAHKAFISVDEYGTLAAAGTATGFTVGIPPEFYAVRPFIFVIRDDATGTILFLGRVLDPSIH